MRPILRLVFAPLLSLLAATPSLPVAATEDFETRVVMKERSAATFYVPGAIPGYGALELMVDTGSGYMTINQRTLDVLQGAGTVRYVKQLQGILADGSEMVVPVYAIARVRIGHGCWIEDVEAAVFPGNARQILGLSALRKTAPFVFSVNPPELLLSRCNGVTPPPGEPVAG